MIFIIVVLFIVPNYCCVMFELLLIAKICPVLGSNPDGGVSFFFFPFLGVCSFFFGISKLLNLKYKGITWTQQLILILCGCRLIESPLFQ